MNTDLHFSSSSYLKMCAASMLQFLPITHDNQDKTCSKVYIIINAYIINYKFMNEHA